jgi:DNA sulfur modification protein DndC
MAPLDKRMWVYILGRGVPPPNNNTLRYCTRQIKIEPMADGGPAAGRARGRKVLVLTGVRLGESAARDNRIALACTTSGAECGQGWFPPELEGGRADTLAPIVHWRVCHVWEWLNTGPRTAEFGDWSTRLLAEAYGGRRRGRGDQRPDRLRLLPAGEPGHGPGRDRRCRSGPTSPR